MAEAAKAKRDANEIRIPPGPRLGTQVFEVEGVTLRLRADPSTSCCDLGSLDSARAAADRLAGPLIADLLGAGVEIRGDAAIAALDADRDFLTEQRSHLRRPRGCHGSQQQRIFRVLIQ